MGHFIKCILLLAMLLPSTVFSAEGNSALRREFWVWDLKVMPPAFRKATATLRAQGEHSMIYVEDSLWEKNVPARFVRKLSKRLETSAKESAYFENRGIVSAEEEIFGPLPRVINLDPRLIVVFADLGQYKNYKFDGFFNPFDQMTDEAALRKHQQHSNEANIIYVNGMRESEDYTEAVIAHELQHLLAHHAPQAPDFQQDLWLSETLAEGAMLLTGYYTDQGHVDRYLKDPAAHSLVSSTYVQYGPQILFASFLIDTLKRTGSFGSLTRSALPGKEAVTEAFRSRSGGAPLNFDAIYSLFITYISQNLLGGQKLPASWKHSTETGLDLNGMRVYAKVAVPGFIEGDLAPYSFAPYMLSRTLTELSNVSVETVQTTGSCLGKGSALWKPLSPQTIAVYAIGCERNSKDDTIRFRLRISEAPTIFPASTIPFFHR